MNKEIARIGFFDEFELLIWTDDSGIVPHFHIRDRSTKGENFNCCVRLDIPEYFNHTGKEDKLNSKQKKNLVSFMEQEVDFAGIKVTNWDKVIMYWNDNNSNIVLPNDFKMPDYTKLN